LTHADDPILTIDNAEHAGSDGSGHCTIIFAGENGSGAEVAQRAKIIVDHPGSGTDEKGDMKFYTNAESEGTSPGLALTLEADNDALFTGDVKLAATKKLYLDGGTHTYLHEKADDEVVLVCGGEEIRIADATGSYNTIYGVNCAQSLDASSAHNVFMGYNCADDSLNNADYNVGIGSGCMGALTAGDYNVGIGYSAFLTHVDNDYNVGIGYQAQWDSGGDHNTSVGAKSLLNNEGDYNTAVGDFAAASPGNEGDYNSYFGASAVASGVSAANEMALGANSVGHGDNKVTIGDASVVSIEPHSDQTCDLGILAYEYDQVHCVNATEVSDERLKEDIADTSLGLEFVNKLRPVSYIMKDIEEKSETYKAQDVNSDGEEIEVEKTRLLQPAVSHSRKHQGLIAQEVKGVMDEMDIDSNDFGGYVDGKIGGDVDKLALRYREFIAPLIKAVQELSAKVEALENQ
jgi:hypothetical protein